MKPMRRPVRLRMALWAFAAVLLLRAAMPLLAAAAAGSRGVPLAAVCSVYGVARPAAANAASPRRQDERDSAADAEPGHCALVALGELAGAGATPATAVRAGVRVAALPAGRAGLRARDACADWVARLEHGPPARRPTA